MSQFEPEQNFFFEVPEDNNPEHTPVNVTSDTDYGVSKNKFSNQKPVNDQVIEPSIKSNYPEKKFITNSKSLIEKEISDKISKNPIPFSGTVSSQAFISVKPKIETGFNSSVLPAITFSATPTERIAKNLPDIGSVFGKVSLEERFHIIFRQLGITPSLESPIVIGVTSSIRGEGRTFTALGLATAIAQQIPQPVLLLEADLSQPKLAQDMALTNPGLTEYLNGEIELDELLLPTEIPGLSLILAGKVEENPLKILRSELLDQLIASLSGYYAAIVVDMPPLSVTAQSNRLLSLVDFVLMVVQAGTTPARLARAALQIIPEEKRTGVILNRTRQPFGAFSWIRKFFNKEI